MNTQWMVVNGGTIDAILLAESSTNLIEEQAQYLEYTITYDNGVELSKSDELLAGNKNTIKIRIQLKNEKIVEDLNFTIETSLNYVSRLKY